MRRSAWLVLGTLLLSVCACEAQRVPIDSGTDATHEDAFAEDAFAADAFRLPDAPTYVDAGTPPRFMVGLSQIRRDIVSLAQQTGTHWIRQTVGWDAVERTIAPNGLTLEEAMSRDALEAYIASHDFAEADDTVTRFTNAGMEVVIGVGSGWNQAIPTLEDGRPAAPDFLGRDEYIARQVLVTRALVERFDADGYLDASGSPRVDFVQIENELNEAVITAVGGSRAPSGIDAVTSAWANRAFVDQLLRALAAAVRDVNPSAIVLTNLHVSIPANFDRLLRVDPWPLALARWVDVLDVIGLDAYPNFLRADPVDGQRVGDQIRQAREIGRGRFVMVIETGYASGPAEVGFDEARQAEYLRESFAATREAGAIGHFWYGSITQETPYAPSAEDIAAFAELAAAYETGDASAFLRLMSDPTYFQAHLVPLIDAMSGHLGLVRADGTHKAAWDAYITETMRP
jgi:hypothetical protein